MSSVVLELQNDCLAKDKSLIDILHKAFLVAQKLDLHEFKVWINQELDGYPKGSQIPNYRETICELKAKNPYRGWIPYYITDKEFDDMVRKIRIPTPISEIEQLSRCDPEAGNLIIPLSGEGIAILQKLGNCSFDICQFVSVTVMNKICNSVKKIILEWTIDLEKQGILGEGLLFTPEEKVKAMNQTINIGGNFQGVLGSVQDSNMNQHLNLSITKGNQTELIQTLIQYGIEDADISKLIEAIEQDSISNGKKNQGQFGPKVSSWIETMIAKAVEGVWNVPLNVGTNLLTLALSRYFGL
ncbi:MAG: hypothetical protein WC748_10145 [Legionellales bacterium]|jgi:hypothetical protein